MINIEIFEKLYRFFSEDPLNFILFISLCVNVYLFKEYVGLLKDNVDISKKISVLISNFDPESKKMLNSKEEQKSESKNNTGSNN